MAAHDDLSGSEKKSNDATNDIPTFNAENLQSNMKVIYYSMIDQSKQGINLLNSYGKLMSQAGISRFSVGGNPGGRGCHRGHSGRTFMSIIGGVIAGILGFTGLMGFVVYLLIMAVTSIGLTAKAGFSIHSYFDSWNRILLDGFLGGLMSFVLFWTDFMTVILESSMNTTMFWFLGQLVAAMEFEV